MADVDSRVAKTVRSGISHNSHPLRCQNRKGERSNWVFARSLFAETDDTIVTKEVRKFRREGEGDRGIERCEQLRIDEVLRIRKRSADNR